MIVDDYHAAAAVFSVEIAHAYSTAPLCVDARVPATMHLRLLSALYKPTGGRLTRTLQADAPDPAFRAALIEAIAAPRPAALQVLDDRPLAAAIAALTAEAGVSIAFGALIAHAQTSGQPILVDPANEGRWMDAAGHRRVGVTSRRAGVPSAS